MNTLTSPQVSAGGGLNTGRLTAPDPLTKAKRLLAEGFNLFAAANVTGFTKAELDLALWNSLGGVCK